jgi:hypothetical protein
MITIFTTAHTGCRAVSGCASCVIRLDPPQKRHKITTSKTEKRQNEPISGQPHDSVLVPAKYRSSCFQQNRQESKATLALLTMFRRILTLTAGKGCDPAAPFLDKRMVTLAFGEQDPAQHVFAFETSVCQPTPRGGAPGDSCPTRDCLGGGGETTGVSICSHLRGSGRTSQPPPFTLAPGANNREYSLLSESMKADAVKRVMLVRRSHSASRAHW